MTTVNRNLNYSQGNSLDYLVLSGSNEYYTSDSDTVFTGLWMDFTNVTVNTAITLEYNFNREGESDDYRVLSSYNWNSSNDNAVLIEGGFPIKASSRFRVGLKASATTGSSVIVPYQFVYETSSTSSTGSYLYYNYRVVDNNDNAVEDALVTVSSNESGSLVVGSGYTNEHGLVVFYLQEGNTYYFRASKTGIQFNNPISVTIPTG